MGGRVAYIRLLAASSQGAPTLILISYKAMALKSSTSMAQQLDLEPFMA